RNDHAPTVLDPCIQRNVTMSPDQHRADIVGPGCVGDSGEHGWVVVEYAKVVAHRQRGVFVTHSIGQSEIAVYLVGILSVERKFGVSKGARDFQLSAFFEGLWCPDQEIGEVIECI